MDHVPRLKPASFWSFVSFNIPEQWHCVREPEGHWGCYEDDDDTGTVWVGFDVFRMPENEPDIGEAVARNARLIIAEPSVAGFPASRKEIDRSPLHKIVHRTYATESEGELLYFSWWNHFVGHQRRLIAVHLNFVLPVGQLAIPRIAAIAQAVDHELLNATIHGEYCLSD